MTQETATTFDAKITKLGDDILALTLKEGKADVILCASNPLSTQDDVAAALVKDLKVPCFAIKGEDNKTYYKHIKAVLELKPNITMDDGADLVSVIHKEKKFFVFSPAGVLR